MVAFIELGPQPFLHILSVFDGRVLLGRLYLLRHLYFHPFSDQHPGHSVRYTQK